MRKPRLEGYAKRSVAVSKCSHRVILCGIMACDQDKVTQCHFAALSLGELDPRVVMILDVLFVDSFRGSVFTRDAILSEQNRTS